MKVTNRYNLPEQLLKFVEDDLRAPIEDRYSVTEIMKSIKEVILWRRYYPIITQDLSEMVPAAFGQAFHTMMENNDSSDAKTEGRIEVEVLPGIILSGRYDKIENHILIDYKTTSVGKYLRGDFEDYKKQGLMYAWALRKRGTFIEKLRFYIFMKDYSIIKKQRSSNYPEAAVQIWEHDITARDIIDIERYIVFRVSEIERWKNAPDDKLPMPTAEESWYTGDSFAVMKTGSTRALKLCDSYGEAYDEMLKRKGDYIETRKGIHMKSEYSEFFRYYVMKEGE